MDTATLMHAFKRLRIAATTVAATTTGLISIASRRGERNPVALAPGDVAPDFELVGSDGRMHRLADSRGRDAVVLAWFPKAFTLGCTAECESLTRSRQSLRRFDARVFGASLDTPIVTERFSAWLGADFPVLSDPDGTAARAYGVLGASGFPRRWTFYIGPDGRILDIDKRVQSASHGEAVAARLEQLGFSRHA
jgi:thioredoxin-dependent peroxiredoxin